MEEYGSLVGKTDQRRARRKHPKDGGVVYEHLNHATSPNTDQRQKSGLALTGIKSH